MTETQTVTPDAPPSLVLTATDVSVAGPHDPLVAAPDVVAPAGQVTVVAVDPGLATTAFALALAGRVPLLTGSVVVGTDSSPALLQQVTRLVDVEDVTEPEGGLAARHVVAEELGLRDLPAHRHEVQRTLDVHGLGEKGGDRWDQLPADVRTSLLVDIAAAAPGHGVIVVAGPDRHFGSTGEWSAAAERAAQAGHAVVVLVARGAVR